MGWSTLLSLPSVGFSIYQEEQDVPEPSNTKSKVSARAIPLPDLPSESGYVEITGSPLSKDTLTRGSIRSRTPSASSEEHGKLKSGCAVDYFIAPPHCQLPEVMAFKVAKDAHGALLKAINKEITIREVKIETCQQAIYKRMLSQGQFSQGQFSHYCQEMRGAWSMEAHELELLVRARAKLNQHYEQFSAAEKIANSAYLPIEAIKTDERTAYRAFNAFECQFVEIKSQASETAPSGPCVAVYEHFSGYNIKLDNSELPRLQKGEAAQKALISAYAKLGAETAISHCLEQLGAGIIGVQEADLRIKTVEHLISSFNH